MNGLTLLRLVWRPLDMRRILQAVSGGLEGVYSYHTADLEDCENVSYVLERLDLLSLPSRCRRAIQSSDDNCKRSAGLAKFVGGSSPQAPTASRDCSGCRRTVAALAA
ncbi:hypothetical protein KC330_g161 [Hortaea werneckii]|nr:hypothetical protein KC330_g161 [Hortaea werneckii]